LETKIFSTEKAKYYFTFFFFKKAVFVQTILNNYKSRGNPKVMLLQIIFFRDKIIVRPQQRVIFMPHLAALL